MDLTKEKKPKKTTSKPSSTKAGVKKPKTAASTSRTRSKKKVTEEVAVDSASQPVTPPFEESDQLRLLQEESDSANPVVLPVASPVVSPVFSEDEPVGAQSSAEAALPVVDDQSLPAPVPERKVILPVIRPVIQVPRVEGAPVDGSAQGAGETPDAVAAATGPNRTAAGNAPKHVPKTLEQRTYRFFPRIAIARGRQYFTSGWTSEAQWNGNEVSVAVKGTGGNYQTSFDFAQVNESGKLPGKCDCPAYARGVLCKHLWAGILQVDKGGVEGKIPEKGGPIRVIHAVLRQHREERAKLRQQQGGAGSQQSGGNGGTTIQPHSGPGRHHVQASKSHQPRGDIYNWVDRLNKIQGNTFAAPGKLISINTLAFFVVSASETASSGKLTLDLWARRRGLGGDLGPLRPYRVSNQDFSQFEDPKDKELLSLLFKTGNPQVFAPYGKNSPNISSRFVLDPIFETHIIPLLTNRGRLFLSRSQNGIPDSAERSLRMDLGPAYELDLKIENTNTEHYRLDGVIRRENEVKGIHDPIAVLANGFLIFEDRISKFAEPRHAVWTQTLRFPAFIVPKEHGEALLTRLLTDPQAPKVSWPPEMGWTKITIEPKPKGVFRPLGNDPSTGRMSLTVSFDYAGKEIPLSNTSMTIVDLPEKTVYLRNREFEEKTLIEALQILRDPQGTGSVPSGDVYRAATELSQAGWMIYMENQRLRLADQFSMDVSSNTDWFDVQLQASFGESKISREELMQALKSKSGLVKLSDGSIGMIPQDFVSKYAAVTEFGHMTDEGTVRFSRSQGLMLNAALNDDAHVRGDTGFTAFRDRVKKFDGVQSAEAPSGFRGQLRHYQSEGLTWLKFLEEFETGGILADDMGLGKTIQLLAFLLSRAKKKDQPSIVITPKSLTFNWVDEAAKFAPGLKVIQYSGAGRAQKTKELQAADVVVTTYGTLRTDIEQLSEIEFDVAVVDEAQAIKNPKSLAALACKRVRAKHRLALTGTPVENSLNDLFSILEFTNPGLMETTYGKELNADARAALSRILKPFILRRTKQNVLTELPDKSEQVLYCEMSPEERDFYNGIRDFYKNNLVEQIESNGLAKSKLHVLEALLRLRQAACHPGLIDENRKELGSAKLQLLLSQIEELIQEGHKVLVFSQFTSLLALVKQMFDGAGIVYEYLDGQTEDRKAPVERFQNDPKVPVFLISLKAGGTGLNLTAAEYVFILDPWWNPAVEAQAIGRAHRMGQTQKVFAYRMIAKGTVEEKIVELQKSKQELAESIISEDKDFLKKLTREDLEMLLD